MTGPLKKYLNRVVGKEGFFALFRYEATVFFLKNWEGLGGILLRRIFYGGLLGSMGAGVVISSHVSVRIPSRIRIGNNVMIDENVSLDVKDPAADGIVIGDDSVLQRGVILATGNEGCVRLGRSVSVGPYTTILGHGNVEIGDYSAIAGSTFIVSMNHGFQDEKVPIYRQPISAKGIRIGKNVWIGAGVRVVDGVTIDDGAVIGAGAVVTRDIPGRSVAVGVPARVLYRME